MSRRILATIAAAALAATTFMAPAASAQDTAPAVDCSKNKFAAGGYPATQIVPAGYVAIPTPGGLFPWERGGYNVGQQQGAANAVKLLDAYAAACPGKPIVIKGHSYGAAIVATALETIEDKPYAKLVTVDLTGNPRKVGGIEDTLRGNLLPGMTNRGPAVYDVSKFAAVSDRCNARDGICALPPLLRNPIGHFLAIIGYFTGAHRYGPTPTSPGSTGSMTDGLLLGAPGPGAGSTTPTTGAAPGGGSGSTGGGGSEGTTTGNQAPPAGTTENSTLPPTSGTTGSSVTTPSATTTPPAVDPKDAARAEREAAKLADKEAREAAKLADKEARSAEKIAAKAAAAAEAERLRLEAEASLSVG